MIAGPFHADTYTTVAQATWSGNCVVNTASATEAAWCQAWVSSYYASNEPSETELKERHDRWLEENCKLVAELLRYHNLMMSAEDRRTRTRPPPVLGRQVDPIRRRTEQAPRAPPKKRVTPGGRNTGRRRSRHTAGYAMVPVNAAGHRKGGRAC